MTKLGRPKKCNEHLVDETTAKLSRKSKVRNILKYDKGLCKVCNKKIRYCKDCSIWHNHSNFKRDCIHSNDKTVNAAIIMTTLK